MKRTNKSGIVLMYNCNGPKFTKLGHIFAMLGLRMRRIQPTQYGQPLLELAQGVEGTAVEAEAFAENMLVFCGLNQAFLEQLLEVIRLAKLPEIHLKAILTEDNQNWDSVKLHDELLAEKEKIEKAAAEEQ